MLIPGKEIDFVNNLGIPIEAILQSFQDLVRGDREAFAFDIFGTGLHTIQTRPIMGMHN